MLCRVRPVSIQLPCSIAAGCAPAFGFVELASAQGTSWALVSLGGRAPGYTTPCTVGSRRLGMRRLEGSNEGREEGREETDAKC